MDRRSILAGLALGATLAAGPALAQTRWNLPAAYPPDNYLTENLVQFGKDVEQATGGKLVITVHPSASLFKAPEIKRAVQSGQAQVGEVLMSLHENEDPIYGIDVVPFLATSFAEAKRLADASRPAVERKLASQGMILLFTAPWPPQGIYANKPLANLEDMRGLKWRSYNAGTARIAELVGAQPVTIQAAELPQALATGVVNSYMSSGATGFDSKTWESLKFFYDTQAWIPKNMVFMNKAAFDGLDKPTQDAVLASAKAAETRVWARAQERTGWYLDQLKAKGMTIAPPSDALASGFKRIGEQLTADWLKRAGADGQAVVDAYRKTGS